jgi:putative transposase
MQDYPTCVFDTNVDGVLKEICLEISKRYELVFIEISTDKDHVHFLIQSVPTYSPTKIVKIVKSITAREIFHRVPAVKKQLWGGEFWSKGYFISTE